MFMSRTLLFSGTGAEVSLFAHLLRAEGVEVTYEPPEEGRDLGPRPRSQGSTS
jgi:hypothetical protein